MAGVDACRQGARVESVGWATPPAATGRFEQARKVTPERVYHCGQLEGLSSFHLLRLTNALTRHGDWHAIADQAPGRLGTLKGDGQLDLQAVVYST